MAGVALPAATELTDTTPMAGTTTPETFLGETKETNYTGAQKYSSVQFD